MIGPRYISLKGRLAPTARSAFCRELNRAMFARLDKALSKSPRSRAL